MKPSPGSNPANDLPNGRDRIKQGRPMSKLDTFHAIFVSGWQQFRDAAKTPLSRG
jgi:hypothetical protein